MAVSNETILAGLRGCALAAAREFLAAFPAASLTSGRRDVADQAWAMASNVSGNPPKVPPNRQWIADTYASSPPSIACQAWVDLHPDVVTQLDIAAGLQSVLETFSADDLHHLSWHLAPPDRGADAFDVQPVDGPVGDAMSAKLQAIVNAHVASGGHGRFLSREGGLRRFHVQLSPELDALP